MDLVIDANIIFSALIKDGITRYLIVKYNGELFIPKFVYKEIKKNIKTIEVKTKLNRKEIKEVLEKLIKQSNIHIVHNFELEEKFKEADEICPDPDDTHYFATALKKKIGIWSNDKKLKSQNKVEIYNTKEVLLLFGLG